MEIQAAVRGMNSPLLRYIELRTFGELEYKPIISSRWVAFNSVVNEKIIGAISETRKIISHAQFILPAFNMAK